MRWTCFEKRNFMGIELDVLVGHPEHDLLFVATQVAGAAGLKSPSANVSDYRKTERGAEGALTLRDALILEKSISVPKDGLGRTYRSTTALGSESWVYQLLLRGHAPASEPFRKWVTEEVLPTIRKTGQYNAAESSDPIAVGIMDELKLLRGELVELKEIVKALVYWT